MNFEVFVDQFRERIATSLHLLESRFATSITGTYNISPHQQEQHRQQRGNVDSRDKTSSRTGSSRDLNIMKYEKVKMSFFDGEKELAGPV